VTYSGAMVRSIGGYVVAGPDCSQSSKRDKVVNLRIQSTVTGDKY